MLNDDLPSLQAVLCIKYHGTHLTYTRVAQPRTRTDDMFHFCAWCGSSIYPYGGCANDDPMILVWLEKKITLYDPLPQWGLTIHSVRWKALTDLGLLQAAYDRKDWVLRETVKRACHIEHSLAMWDKKHPSVLASLLKG